MDDFGSTEHIRRTKALDQKVNKYSLTALDKALKNNQNILSVINIDFPNADKLYLDCIYFAVISAVADRLNVALSNQESTSQENDQLCSFLKGSMRKISASTHALISSAQERQSTVDEHFLLNLFLRRESLRYVESLIQKHWLVLNTNNAFISTVKRMHTLYRQIEEFCGLPTEKKRLTAAYLNSLLDAQQSSRRM